MEYDKQLSKNKAIELVLFKKVWPCLIAIDIDWTLKRHGNDHWGFRFNFALFDYSIIQINFYDVRHQEDI